MVFRSWLALIVLALGMALWAEEPEIASPAVADTLAEESAGETWEKSAPQEPSKEEVLDWILAKQTLEAKRWQEYVQAAFAPSIYNSHASYTQLESDPYRVSIYGFEHFGTFLDKTLYLGYLNRHYYPQYRAGQLDFEQFDYPYPVSVSGIKGILGDYDTRDLSAFFAKRRLFGFQDLALYADFSLQNAYWLDNPINGSSLRTQLSYQIADFSFRGEYFNIKKEPGSLELLPNYLGSGLYRFKHQYSQLFLTAQSPWLELAFLKSEDKAQNPAWQHDLQSKNWQIAVAQKTNWHKAKLGWRYEYAGIKRNYDVLNTYNQMDYRHKLSLDVDYRQDWDIQIVPQILDWKYPRSDAQVLKHWQNLQVGLYDMRLYRLPQQNYAVQNPFNGNIMSGLAIYRQWESGILGGWQQGALSAGFSAAVQKLSQKSLLHDLADTQFVLRLNGSYHPRVGDWELEIAPNWSYQDNKLYLMENPRFRFGSRQGLTRHLGHDNALSGGFELQGHSNYYMANVVNPVLIEASTMLDLWAEVKIGRLFDFTVQYRNLLSSSIYGFFPLPPAIHAGINWYFIN